MGRLLLAMACLMLLSSIAHADSSDDLAETSCNGRAGLFVIRPFVLGGDNVKPDSGFAVVKTSPTGETSRVVNCLIGTAHIQATIDIYPPQMHACHGGGESYLHGLSANGQQLLSKQVEIGPSMSACVHSDGTIFDRLESVMIRGIGRNITLKICKKRGVLDGLTNVICTKKSFAVTAR